jgi:hypothetical protein
MTIMLVTAIGHTVAAALSGDTVKADMMRRVIHFSGFDWVVKSSEQPVGPGPNLFSDSSDSVWVDAAGQLHMRIVQKDGRWWCAEVICMCRASFGTYRFQLPAGGVRDLDANAVAGLFTWGDAPDDADHEIDIEVSRWGQATRANAQFVVQPSEPLDHISRFDLDADTAHDLAFTWLPGRVLFSALNSASQTTLHGFEVRRQVPRAGGNPRLNLWLVGGREPVDHAEAHLIVRGFAFEPDATPDP